jgi:hypothetical protein
MASNWKPELFHGKGSILSSDEFLIHDFYLITSVIDVSAKDHHEACEELFYDDCNRSDDSLASEGSNRDNSLSQGRTKKHTSH